MIEVSATCWKGLSERLQETSVARKISAMCECVEVGLRGGDWKRMLTYFKRGIEGKQVSAII